MRDMRAYGLACFVFPLVILSDCRCTGRRVDLARVSAAVHRNSGVNPPLDRPLFVIDGTQSIGAMPFDVTVIRPDVVSDF
jgi:selenocysteine lyase/cysteine desulfurase